MPSTKFKQLNESLKEHLCLCLAAPALNAERVLAPLCFMRDEAMQNYINKYNMKGHTNSLMFELISGTYTKEQVHDYFCDIEHGFLHGFCASFWGFHLMDTGFDLLDIGNLADFYIDQDNYLSKLFSCLLHDFVRTSRRGTLESHHDKALKKFFPNLCDETYEHTTSNAHHELICGDRMELFRYNSTEWINSAGLPEHDAEERELFYRCIRPALEHYTLNQDETWFYHWFDTKRDSEPVWDFDGNFKCPQNTYTGRGWAASFFNRANLTTIYPATGRDWQNRNDSDIIVPLTCMGLKKEMTGVSNWYLDCKSIRDRDHYVVAEPKTAADFIIGYNTYYDIDINPIIEGGHRFTESNVVLVYATFLHMMKNILEMHAK